MADTVHRKEEFSDLDWGFVEKKRKECCVGFCSGGHGFSDETKMIYIIEELDNEDIDVDYYILPDYLQYIIEVAEQDGENRVKKNMKNRIKDAVVRLLRSDSRPEARDARPNFSRNGLVMLASAIATLRWSSGRNV